MIKKPVGVLLIAVIILIAVGLSNKVFFSAAEQGQNLTSGEAPSRGQLSEAGMSAQDTGSDLHTQHDFFVPEYVYQQSGGVPGENAFASSSSPISSVVVASSILSPEILPDAMVAQTYRLGLEERVVAVENGDTFLAVLLENGLTSRAAYNLIAALEESEIYDPARLRVGQNLYFHLSHYGTEYNVDELQIAPDVERFVVVTPDPQDYEREFAIAERENVLTAAHYAAQGTITSSLFLAGQNADVPAEILINMVRIYSYDVDFQRDIRQGDGFEILYEREYDERGDFARNGEVLFANLILGGRDRRIYRFESEDGLVDYYDREGKSIRRALMRTPVDGARLSSHFGPRRHPVLGYTRMHRGTDFAAPTGTPIYAAGDGVVEFLGRNSGYGNYIRIRHNSGLATAYGHMHGYAEGLSRGDRVTQGEIIGYVGSTGLSTGPHLHYEVLVNGEQVNPMSIDLPTGRTLEDAELAEFQRMVLEQDALYAQLQEETNPSALAAAESVETNTAQPQ